MGATSTTTSTSDASGATTTSSANEATSSSSEANSSSTSNPSSGPIANDVDGDNVPDTQDNCPNKSNADQHDEDEDGVGDVCDNCPGIHNPGQDNDSEIAMGEASDAVGDACDPNPTRTGDRIAIFDPFVKLDRDWNQLNGTWKVERDRLHTTTTEAGALVRSDVSASTYTIETVIRSGALFTPPDGTALGIISQESPSGRFLCDVSAYLDQGGDTRYDLEYQYIPSIGRPSLGGNAKLGNLDLESGYRMRLTSRGNTGFECMLISLAPQGPQDDVSGTLGSTTAGNPGLLSGFGPKAEFDYFIVYTTR